MDDEVDSSAITSPLMCAILVATASQFLVGYNTSVMNTPEAFVFPGHSTGLWSLAVAAFAVGGPFGAIAGGKLADQRGRRGALLVDTWTFLVGGLLQTLAWNMSTIILSRFIVGFASGFSSVLVPIYLGEVAPLKLRGMIGTFTQFALVIGILAADLCAFPFAKDWAWRFLFLMTPIVAAAQLLCSPFLLESPRWLISQGSESSLARSVIQRLRGLEHDHEVDLAIRSLEILNGRIPNEPNENQTETLLEMAQHPQLRSLLLSSLFLQMAQQLCGINAVFYYSTAFFQGVIHDPLVGTSIVGAINVLSTLVAVLLMDSCGRRTLLLCSSGGMFLACFAIVMTLLGYFSNVMALLFVNVYVIFFAIGLGPIPWLIAAEMFQGKYLAVAMSACSQLNWACNFIVGLVFPYLHMHLGPFSFVPFAVVLAVTFLFTLTILPETQGTTPEDFIFEMVRRNSVRNLTLNQAEDKDGANMFDPATMEQLVPDEIHEGHSSVKERVIAGRELC